MSTISGLKQKIGTTMECLAPKQKYWLGLCLMAAGVSIIVKMLWLRWPSLHMAIMATAIFVLGSICCIKTFSLIPVLNKMLKWCVPIFAGALLNFTVTLANKGFMPTTYPINGSLYIPMQGAKLAHLGDWLWLGCSPGDILLLAGGLGIAITVIIGWHRKVMGRQLSER